MVLIDYEDAWRAGAALRALHEAGVVASCALERLDDSGGYVHRLLVARTDSAAATAVLTARGLLPAGVRAGDR